MATDENRCSEEWLNLKIRARLKEHKIKATGVGEAAAFEALKAQLKEKKHTAKHVQYTRLVNEAVEAEKKAKAEEETEAERKKEGLNIDESKEGEAKEEEPMNEESNNEDNAATKNDLPQIEENKTQEEAEAEEPQEERTVNNLTNIGTDAADTVVSQLSDTSERALSVSRDVLNRGTDVLHQATKGHLRTDTQKLHQQMRDFEAGTLCERISGWFKRHLGFEADHKKKH